MIDLLEIALCLIIYIAVGLVIARLQSKRIYRQMQKYYTNKPENAEANYLSSLAGWVFFWPLRTVSTILKLMLVYLVVKPAEATTSWCVDLIKAPVATTLNMIKQAEQDAEEWAKKLKEPDLDEIEKEVAQEMREAAYARQKAACADLGIDPSPRRAITSSQKAQDIARGMEAARAVLRTDTYPGDYYSTVEPRIRMNRSF